MSRASELVASGCYSSDGIGFHNAASAGARDQHDAVVDPIDDGSAVDFVIAV